MKKLGILMLLCCMVILTANTQAAVLVYESWGDCTEGQAFTGYSGTDGITEVGLTGTWAATNTVSGMNERTEIYSGIESGYAPDYFGGNHHKLEHNNTWNLTRGTRPLASNIDLTTDGTYYLSFFGRSGGDDVVTQLGFNNGTNELMFGQGWNRGVTSYYGPIGTAADTNNADPDVDISITNWDTVFWVAKLVKSGSGVTNTLEVYIQYYDLATNNVIGNEDPATWTRTMALTGVSANFNTLQIKLDGTAYPSIDELRVGQSWFDVTGVAVPAEDLISGYVGDMTDDVINPGFELPAQGKIKGWDGEGVDGTPAVDVPGWTSMITPVDSGVEDLNPFAGDYRGFKMDTDDAVYQITDVNIVADQHYTLEVQMAYTGGGGEPNCIVGLFYLSNPADPNSRVFLGDGPVVDEQLTGTYKSITTSFTASSAGPEVGKGLWIVIDTHAISDPENNSWVGFDEIKLVDYVIHGVLDQAPDGADVIPTAPSDLVLSWTPCNDPNLDGTGTDGQTLYYYIGNGDGSNPDYEAYVASGGIPLASYTTSSYSITGGMGYDQYCLWRVDTVIDGVTYTGKTIFFTTQTADLVPDIQEWDWVVTWVGQSTTIYADVNDFGEGDLVIPDSYAWSVVNNDPNISVTNITSDPLYAEASVTTTSAVPGTYQVELVVTDVDGTLGPQASNTASFTIKVAADACEATKDTSSAEVLNYYDDDDDCDVDIVDFAAFALQWLDDSALLAPSYY